MLNSSHLVVTIRAPKRLDHLTAPHLARDLEAKIYQGRTIVLDFSQTHSIEAESAEIVLHGWKLAKERDARFLLRGIQEPVKLVLELSGVLQFFRKKPT